MHFPPFFHPLSIICFPQHVIWPYFCPGQTEKYTPLGTNGSVFRIRIRRIRICGSESVDTHLSILICESGSVELSASVDMDLSDPHFWIRIRPCPRYQEIFQRTTIIRMGLLEVCDMGGNMSYF